MSAGNHNPINNGPHVRQQLSDYMDGLLRADDREAVRAHLEQCADCRAYYIELRATQRLMQNMPAVAAPRSFTLTPQMAGKARRLSFWQGFFSPRNAPRLATGSVVAFLLLFVFIANDFLGSAHLGQSSVTPLLNPNAAPSGVVDRHIPSSSDTGPSSSAKLSPTETTAAAGVASSSSSSGGAPPPAAAEATAPPIPPAAAAPTTTTAAAGVAPGDTTAPPPAAPTTTIAAAAAAPTETTAPADHAQNTLPTEAVAGSANGNPTTTTLNTPTLPQFQDNLTATNSTTGATQAQAGPPSPPPTDNSTLLIAVQVALFALALALATAAFISWRRA